MSEPANRIIVGFDGLSSAEDALIFAENWCLASGDELLCATVTPVQPFAVSLDAEWRQTLADEADKLLARAQEIVAGRVDAKFIRIESDSAARGLHELTEQGCSLVAVGARPRRGGPRRTFPGSTGIRLLHGASCPVAVIPDGYALDEPRPLRKITVAYIATPDGNTALDHAVRMCRHVGASLEVISVLPDTSVITGFGQPRIVTDAEYESYQAALADVTKGLDDINATAKLLPGPVVEALTDIRRDETDLLVVGSRGYGPVGRVLLGGVSHQVVRNSRVPVVVVPRSAS